MPTEEGSWEVTTEIVGVEKREWVPANQLPVPAVAQTTPYVVARGDTLSGIAAQFGLRWQDIAAVNPGLDPNRLRVNQTIYLPGAVDVTQKRAVQPRPVVAATTARPAATTADNVYIVKRGDTLGAIALKHGVKLAELKAANNLTSDLIRENQKLVLPAGAKKDGATVKPPAPPRPLDPKPADNKPPQETVKPPVAPPTPTPAEVVTPPPVPEQVIETVAVSEFRTYVVQPGEDIFAVAFRWGTSPNELRELNNIVGHTLKPGTELKIPPPAMPAP